MNVQLKYKKRLPQAFILLVFYSNILNAQINSDTVNKFNKEGIKMGYWKAFYNQKNEIIQDSAFASHYGYEYYINGELYKVVLDKYFYNIIKTKYIPYDSLETNKILNGEINYYDNHNNIICKETYINGYIIKSRIYSYYYDSTISSEEILDYKNKYLGNIESYFYEKNTYKILRDKWESKIGYYVFGKNYKKKFIKLHPRFK